MDASIESIEFKEELIERSIKGRVQRESESHLVHLRLCGWRGSKVMDYSIKWKSRIKWPLP